MCVLGEESFKQEFYSSERSGRSCRKKRLKLLRDILAKLQALNLEKIYQKKNFYKRDQPGETIPVPIGKAHCTPSWNWKEIQILSQKFHPTLGR